MSNTLILVRQKRGAKGDSRVIRVSGDIYTAISELSDDTSISINALASKLIAFALDHVKVIDGEEDI